VQLPRLNPSQRNVIVVGLGVALYFAGQWIMTWGGTFGGVAYAPLSKAVSGPFLIGNPWAQFLIWLGLVLVWIVCSLIIYGSSGKSGMDRPNELSLTGCTSPA
jgi:hypothetical protein